MDFFEEQAKGVFVHGNVVCYFVQCNFPVVVFDDISVDGLQALFVFMNGHAIEGMMADVSAVAWAESKCKDLQQS